MNESGNERVNIELFFKKQNLHRPIERIQLFSTAETGGFLTRIIAVSCDLLTCVPLCRAGLDLLVFFC
jgi:hypothetical protein